MICQQGKLDLRPRLPLPKQNILVDGSVFSFRKLVPPFHINKTQSSKGTKTQRMQNECKMPLRFPLFGTMKLIRNQSTFQL